MICFFSSKTNNTKHFVENFNEYETLQINKSKDLIIKKPFILFVATYANSEGKKAIPSDVISFIKNNNNNMIGVISSGNKSFGKMFGISGNIIARNCNVPLFHKYELRGTQSDIDKVRNILNENIKMI